MTPTQYAILLAGSILGGALNSVVGGGSFVAFPALVFAGVPPVAANATSTFALWPAGVASAWAYRNDLRHPRALGWAMSAASLVGGGVGALALLRTSNTLFVRLIPWLMLVATLLFSFGGHITTRLRAGRAPQAADSTTALLVGTLAQLAISIYGGYFGGGMGIMMLATMSLLGMTDIHAMNGLRSVLGVLINGVAVAAFLASGLVALGPGIIMVAGATAAGYLGAAAARRIDPTWVRRFVMAVAWTMTAVFFARALALF